ncbi:hypothetical protein INS49_011955 [Diaporthe citri]|uniref:uncharacterized protein n=1 Tax=Diaporthe citri TaxID=83186 RepID=UPI001C7F536A|nr:uncharacterized protein INS49_011955 [Diaporthe citri]KAG6360887.1 hypothetical protein INS49_011955 [Diaporthe citri]
MWFIAVQKEPSWEQDRFLHEYQKVHVDLAREGHKHTKLPLNYVQVGARKLPDEANSTDAWDFVTCLYWPSTFVVWKGFQSPAYQETAGKHVFCRLYQKGVLARKVGEVGAVTERFVGDAMMEVEDIYQEYDHFNEEANYWDDKVDNAFSWKNALERFRMIVVLQKLHEVVLTKRREPQEVRQEINTRTRSIFKDYDTLNQILARHEATIQKRWMKKTRTQRLKFLLHAWPDMAAVHRPDFHAFRTEAIEERKTQTRFRDHYIWPYINQEDLCKPKLMLLLLNSRGRNLPGQFAAGDIDAMHLGRKLEALKPDFLREYIMIMDGALGENEYGSLVPRDYQSDWMDGDQKQISPGEGLLILEAQEKLLAFLVDCCHQILHDLTETEILSDRFPVLSEPCLRMDTEVNGFDSLAIIAAEAPYRVPAKLDFDRLISLLSARASAAEDHMWALREDPGYFSEHVHDMKEHDPEIIKDFHGHTPFDDHKESQQFWGRAVMTLLFEAYKHYEMYSQLHQESRQLQSLQDKYASRICPDKDLPEEYQRAMLNFHFHLNEAAWGACYHSSEKGLWIIPRPGKKIDKIGGQLMLLLKTLWESGKPLEALRWTLMTDELERLVESEPRAKELLSPYIACCVGELSIISQCMRQLELYQPWARGFSQKMRVHKNQIDEDFDEQSRAWQKIGKAFYSKTMREVLSHGMPTRGKFTYPIEKRRTKERVETLRRAESNLDSFWARFDEEMSLKAGNIETTALHRLLTQPRALQRTSEWVDERPMQMRSASSGHPRQQDDYHAMAAMSFSAIHVEQPSHGSSHPNGNSSLPRKSKLKTRKAASAGIPEVHTTDQSSVDADSQTQVEVDQRTYKVFRTLFFNAESTSMPAEIQWIDFLRAMAAMGFSVEKLYGSVWIFCPATNSLGQSIQFHEPHPRSKLPFTTARRYGRRLNRAFGWTGGMFIPKKK